MAISVDQIQRMKPGQKIVDGDGLTWPIVENESRADGWRHIVLAHPETEQNTWFWFHPDEQCIVSAENLDPVPAFSDPKANLLAA